jgi:hypothetical protein
VALEEREARYRALVNVIPDLLIRIDADGTYLDVITGGESNPSTLTNLSKGSIFTMSLPSTMPRSAWVTSTRPSKPEKSSPTTTI